MAQEQLQMVDPSEFDNITAPDEQNVAKSPDIKLAETENAGVDLATTPEETTDQVAKVEKPSTVDKQVQQDVVEDKKVDYVADEASVTKPVIRTRSSKYFVDDRDKLKPTTGLVPGIKTTQDIIAAEDEKAGLYTRDMKSEAEKDLEDQDKPVNPDELLNIWRQNKIPPAELRDEEWDDLSFAYTVLYNPGNNQFSQQEKTDAKQTINDTIQIINGLRKKKGVKVAFDRDGQFQATERALEEKKYGDNDLYNDQEKYQEGRKQLYSLVKGVGKNISEFRENDKVVVQQILMDKIVTGEFWEALKTTANETVRAFALDLPNFAYNMIYYGGQAVFKGARDPFKSTGDYWKETESLRENSIKGWKEAISGGDPIQLSDHINDTIHSELKKMLDKGTIDRETYDRITTVQDVGTQGQVQRVRLRNIVDETQAQSFLNESLNQLSSTDTFLLIAAENLAGMGGLANVRKARALSSYKNLEKNVSKETLKKIKQGDFTYLGMTTVEAARKLKADGVKIKINEDLIQQALRIDLNKTQVLNMKRGLEKKGEELDNLKDELKRKFGRDFDPMDNTEYLKAKNEYDSLKGKLFRNHFLARSSPFFRETAQIALPASITQYAAVELLGTSEGGDTALLDFYSAQGVGALIHFFGSIPIKGISLGGLLTAAPRYLAQQAGPVKDAILDLGETLRLPVDIFRSKDIEELDALVAQARNGRGLNMKERRGAEYIFNLANVMPKNRLDKVLDNLTDQIDLEERIIKQFPQEEQAEIRKLVSAPFAQASGLTWLMSASAMSGTGIDIRDVKSLVKAEELQEIADSKIAELALLSRGLDQLRSKLRNRTDIENPQAVENFIDKYKKLYELNMKKIEDENTAFANTVIKMKETVFLDTDSTIDKSIFNSLSRASVNARMQLNKVLTEGEAIEQDQTDNFKLLAERAKIIKSRQKSPESMDQSALLLERIFEEHIRGFYLRGKLGYKEVDQLAKKQNKYIDITELMFEFKEIADPLKATGFGTFFGRKGKFFDTTLNSQLRFSLNKMAVRTLSQLKGTTLRKLRQMARDKDSKHYIAKDADDMDIALYYYEKGDLKAFKALPSQLTDVYAAFRDYGYRLDSQLPDEKKKFVSLFKGKADDIIKMVEDQAPEYAEKYKEASANYKKEVFDRLDGGGPITTFLKSKSLRETEVSKSGENKFFQNVYAGKTPDEIVREVIPKMDRYVNKGDEGARTDIRNFFLDFSNQFTDFEKGSNKPAFNLDTELGKAKFDGLQEAFTNFMYHNYATKFTEQYKKLDPRVKSQLQSKMGGYDFSILDEDRLNELTRLSSVDVIINGKPDTRNLLNLSNLISDNKDIVKLMAENKTARESYSRFVATGNERINTILKGEAVKEFRKRDFVLEQISDITGYKGNPLGFFTNYVENGTVEGLRLIKQDILSKAKKLDGETITEKDLDDTFLYLAVQGAYAKGGLRTSASKKIPTFDGFYKPIRQFTNVDELFGAFNGSNSKAILSDIIGEEHTEFLADITELMLRKQESLIGTERITGLTRPISTNEIISRGFNLARGMVSPAYVGAEIAFRLASNAGIEMLGMAANSKEAARLMKKMFEFPEKITKVELSKFKTLAVDYVLTEYARQDLNIADYFYDPTQQD